MRSSVSSLSRWKKCRTVERGAVFLFHKNISDSVSEKSAQVWPRLDFGDKELSAAANANIESRGNIASNNDCLMRYKVGRTSDSC